MLANQVDHSVEAMCRVLRISRHSYYKWKRVGASFWDAFGYLLVTDASSRRIIGRQFSLCHDADAELMLDALRQTVCGV